MEAMENSMAQRSDLLELECQLARDKVVVVSHDENLYRQSGLNRDVGSLDFEDLPLYKEELEVYFSPGESKGFKPCLGHVRLPWTPALAFLSDPSSHTTPRPLCSWVRPAHGSSGGPVPEVSKDTHECGDQRE